MSITQPSPNTADVAHLASRQHGLISRKQLRMLGFADTRIRSWVDSGRLRSVDLGVFHVNGAPFTWHTRVLAACLASGGVASHRTAACLWGFRGFSPGPPEISVPRNRRYRVSSCRVHHPKDFALIRPARIEAIPTTDAARTLIDLAGVVPFTTLDRSASQFVNRRLGDWSDLLAAHTLHARRGKAGTVAMRAALDLHFGTIGTTESDLEDRLVELFRAAGLPEPALQHEIYDGDVFVMRADVAWPAFKVAAEADSIEHHLNAATFTADRVKRATARRIGWAVQEYTNELMTNSPTWVCEDAASMLRSRGASW